MSERIKLCKSCAGTDEHCIELCAFQECELKEKGCRIYAHSFYIKTEQGYKPRGSTEIID